MPKPLPRSLWGWIPQILRYSQDEIVELAGYDAAMYMRILGFGVVSWCLDMHSQFHCCCFDYQH